MDSKPDAELKPISSEQYSTAPDWDDRTSTIIGVGFGLLLIVLAITVWAVIPLALGTAIIAYLLNPLTDTLQKRITFGRRGWAVLFTFLVILLIIILVFVVLIPPLIEQTINATTSLWNTLVQLVTEPVFISEGHPLLTDPKTLEAISIGDYINLLLQEQGFTTVNEWLLATSQNLTFDRQTIQQFFSIGGGITSGLVGSVFTIAGSTLALVLNTLFFLAICASLLGGGSSITDTILDTVPDGYEADARRLLGDLGGVWDSYVRGNFTLGLIMGFGMWVIAIVLGLPNPLFLAFIAFGMEFVPNLGPAIAMLFAVALALIGGSSTFPHMNHFAVTGIVVVVWFVMQQLEATVLVPRIVGESLNLHPAIVILSVIWGGSFGGLIGVVVAPPLVASARTIMHYIYGRLTGRTAFAKREPDSNSPLTRLMHLRGQINRLRQRLSKK